MSGILSREKVPDPQGTWEDHDVAFQLFLGPRPRIFGSYAFLNTPHIGMYDHDDYTPALPIALLSVPLVDAERQLPKSIVEVLDVCRNSGLIRAPLEMLFMIHSGLVGVGLRECGYIACHNTDEFNVMFTTELCSHTWTFQDDNVSEGHDEIVARIHMGLFEPLGVRPVHVDRGGMAFGLLSSRSVILHDRRFSPNNANVQLTGDVDTPVFFTMALDRALYKAVVTCHVLPVGDGPSDRVRGWIRGACSLRDLMRGLEEHLPAAHTHLCAMVAPLLEADGGADAAAAGRSSGAAARGGADECPGHEAAPGSDSAAAPAPGAGAAAAVGSFTAEPSSAVDVSSALGSSGGGSSSACGVGTAAASGST